MSKKTSRRIAQKTTTHRQTFTDAIVHDAVQELLEQAEINRTAARDADTDYLSDTAGRYTSPTGTKYISNEEAERIDAEAARRGVPALRAPSRGIWARWMDAARESGTLSRPEGSDVADHLTPTSKFATNLASNIREGNWLDIATDAIEAAADVGQGIHAVRPGGRPQLAAEFTGKAPARHGAAAGYLAERQGVPVRQILESHGRTVAKRTRGVSERPRQSSAKGPWWMSRVNDADKSFLESVQSGQADYQHYRGSAIIAFDAAAKAVEAATSRDVENFMAGPKRTAKGDPSDEIFLDAALRLFADRSLTPATLDTALGRAAEMTTKSYVYNDIVKKSTQRAAFAAPDKAGKNAKALAGGYLWAHLGLSNNQNLTSPFRRGNGERIPIQPMSSDYWNKVGKGSRFSYITDRHAPVDAPIDFSSAASVANYRLGQLLRKARLTPDEIAVVAGSASLAGKKAVIGRDDFPHELVGPLLAHGTAPVVEMLLKSRKTTDADVAHAILANPDSRVPKALATTDSPHLKNPEVLNLVVGSGDPYALSMVAKSKNPLPPDVIEKLANNPSPYVQFYVATRKDTPQDILNKLALSENPFVKNAAIPRADGLVASDLLASTVEAFKAGQPNAAENLARFYENPHIRNLGGQLDELMSMLPAVINNIPGDQVRQLMTYGVSNILRSNAVPPQAKAKYFADMLSDNTTAGPLGLGSTPFYTSKQQRPLVDQWLDQQVGLFLTDPTSTKRDAKSVAARQVFVSSLLDELESRAANGTGNGRAAMLLASLAKNGVHQALSRPVVGTISLDKSSQDPSAYSTRTYNRTADQHLNADQQVKWGPTGPQSADEAERWASGLEDEMWANPNVSPETARSITARALWAERRLREMSGSDIVPGDSSSKLGWLRDATTASLTKPVLQSTDKSAPPVVMWLHPGIGKSRGTPLNGDFVDYDYVRTQHIPAILAGRGYPEYERAIADGKRFNIPKFKKEHPGVFEQADSDLLDMMKESPAMRGRLILTSVHSLLKDRPGDMDVIVDTPRETFLERGIRREMGRNPSMTREQAAEGMAEWKDLVDMSLQKARELHPERYLATDKSSEDLVYDEAFEKVLASSGGRAQIVDTGALGVGGVFASGTAGDLAYTMNRRHFRGDQRPTNVRIFSQPLSALRKNPLAMTLHDDDAGTGTIEDLMRNNPESYRLDARGQQLIQGHFREDPFSIIDWRDPYWRQSGISESKAERLAKFATLHPEDATWLTREAVMEGGSLPVPMPTGSNDSQSMDVKELLLATFGNNQPIPHPTPVKILNAKARAKMKADPGYQAVPRDFVTLSPRAQVALSYFAADNTVMLASGRGQLATAPGAKWGDIVVGTHDAATPEQRFKAAVALRRLDSTASLVRQGKKVELPTESGQFHASRSESTEFKPRGMTPDQIAESAREIIVPEGYQDTAAGQYIQRKYPHIKLIPTNVESKADFAKASGEAMMRTREAAKGGDARETMRY